MNISSLGLASSPVLISPSHHTHLDLSTVHTEMPVKKRIKACHILYDENEGKPNLTCSLKQFFKVHASTIGNNNAVDGEGRNESLKYWIKLINYWKYETNPLFNHGLSQHELFKISESLQECEELETCLLFDSNNFLLQIEKKLNAKNSCFFPTGWFGSPGHFMLAKVEKRPGQILAFELMTKGAGGAFHQVSDRPYKTKINYKSDVFLVKESTFYGPAGQSFITRLSLLLKNKNCDYASRSFNFTAIDLYGLFYLLSEGNIQGQSDGFAVTPQRSGNCEDSGLRMALYEVILQSNPSLSSTYHKRSMFAFKFQSLVEGFKQYKEQLKEGDQEVCKLIGHAAREHIVRLNKLYPEILSQEEFELGVSIGEEILDQVAYAEELIMNKKVELCLPALNSNHSEIGQGSKEVSSYVEKKSSYVHVETFPKLPRINSFNLEPQQILRTLKRWNTLLAEAKIFNEQLTTSVFYKIAELMEVLTLPSGEPLDPYWDEIAIEDYNPIIEELTKLVTLAYKTGLKDEIRFKVILSIAYDITYQLALKIPELQLSGYYLPAPYYKKLFVNFKTSKILNTIHNNFLKRKGTNNKQLFPNAFFSTARNDHWEYLNKFYTLEIKNELFNRLKDEKKCINSFILETNKKYFPPAFYALHSFAYLSHTDTLDLLKSYYGETVDSLYSISLYEMISQDRFQFKTHNQKAYNPSATFVEDLKPLKRAEGGVLVNIIREYNNKPDKDVSLQTIQEILLLDGTFQISQAIMWCQNHFHLMHEPKIRKLIENILFDFNDVQVVFEEMPEIMTEKVNHLTAKGLNFFLNDKSNQETILWFSMIVIYLRGFIPPSLSTNSAELDLYKPLEELYHAAKNYTEKLNVLHHLILTFINTPLDQFNHPSISRLATLGLRCRYLAGSHYLLKSNVSKEAENILIRSRAIFLNFFERCNIDLTLNQILTDFIEEKIPAKVWTHENQFLLFKSDEYELDLETFHVYNDQQLITNIQSHLHYSDFQFLIDANCKYKLKDGYYYQLPQEKLRICSDFKEVHKLFVIGSTQKWMVYVPLTHLDNFPLPEPLKHNSFCFWKSIEEPSSIYRVDKNSWIASHVYFSNEGWRSLDPRTGEVLNERIVDLLSEQTQRLDWLNFISFFEPCKEVLLTEIKHVSGEWVINKLEMPRLKLSFSGVMCNQKTRLKCHEIEGFYLAENQQTPRHELPTALLLEDITGKLKQIILPLKAFVYRSKYDYFQKSSKLTKKSLLTSAHAFISESENRAYFIYHAQSTLNISQLIAESPQAALFLSLVLRKQEKYEEAFLYLSKSEHFERNTEFDWQIVSKMLFNTCDTNDTPTHPSLSAFDLHLDSRMSRHELKFTKGRLNNEKFYTFKLIKDQFTTHISNAREYYFQTLSEMKEGVASLPFELRLPLSQKNDPRPFKVFSHTLVSSLNIHDCKVLGSHDLFQRITSQMGPNSIITGFVRLPKNYDSASSYLTVNFFYLFDEILNSNPDHILNLKMDLFFLAKHDSKEESIVTEITQILGCVCDHPSQFKSISETFKFNFNLSSSAFYGQAVEQLKIKDLKIKAIVRKCEEIKKSPRSYSIAASATSSFSIKRPMILDIKPDQEKKVIHSLKENTNVELDISPLRVYLNQLFEVFETYPYRDKNFALAGMTTKNKLADKLLCQLQEGHEHNQSVRKKEYTLKTSADLNKVKTDIESEIKVKESVLLYLTKQIEDLANKLPTASVAHLLAKSKQIGKQVKKLSLQDNILSCFITHDYSKLAELNPALTKSDLEELNDYVTSLLIHSRKLKLLEQALSIFELIESKESSDKSVYLTQLAKILDSEAAYDFSSHPEYLAYEVATGLILRKDQIEILDWVFDNLAEDCLPHLMFQFQAGGGKTKVLMPILAFKLAHKGFLPILINYSPLYDVGKRDLDKSLSAAFKQQAELLEIELGTKCEKYLEEILESLNKFKTLNKCLIIKSETIYALHLARKKCFETNDIVSLTSLNKIFEFFKSSSVALIDEPHLSLEALQESNEAIGSGVPIAREQQKLFIDLVKMLLGYYAPLDVNSDLGQKPIQEVVRLKENYQGHLSADDIKSLRAAMIPSILSLPLWQDLLGFNATKKFSLQTLLQKLKNYFEDEEKAFPNFVLELYDSKNISEKNMANCIALVKKYLYQLMPHTLSLVQENAYEESIKPGCYTAAPKRDKQHVNSIFQDVYKTAILTIQNDFQVGISEKGLKKLITDLIEDHHIQKKNLAGDLLVTEAETTFNRWWQSQSENAIYLDQVDVNNNLFIQEAMQRLSQNKEVIEDFLTHIALTQLRVYHQKISATPVDLLETFHSSVSFTATPGLIDLYPVALQKQGAVKFDLGFEASVIQVLAQPENQKIITADFSNPDQLFEELYQQDSGVFLNLTTLIDCGGLFRGISNRDLIEKFLTFAESKGIKFDGAIYKQVRCQNLEGRLNYLEKNEAGVSVYPLSGSDLPKAMREIGKNFNALRLVTLFGLEDTTGADYKQPNKGKALLTIGERQKKTNTVQSAMRLRELLIGKESQTVVWGLSHELKKQIGSSSELSVKNIFSWLIHNEAEAIAKTLVMRAYQGIKYLVQKSTWHYLLSLSPEKQIKAYKNHRDGLVDFASQDPLLDMLPMNKGKCEQVLRNYVNRCYLALGYLDENLENISSDDQSSIKLIIAQTAAYVDELETVQSTTHGEMLQQQEITSTKNSLNERFQEIEQQSLFSKNDYTADILAAQNFRFINNKIFEESKYFNLPEECFGLINFLSNRTFVTDNFPKLILERAPLLRPINYILVVKHVGQKESYFKYLLCIKAEAEKLKPHLLGEGLDAKHRSLICEKAVLVDSRGEVIFNGDKNLGFSMPELKELLNSREINKQLCALAFMNGRIYNVPLLHEITLSYSDDSLNYFWQRVLASHVGPDQPNFKAFQELMKLRKRSRELPGYLFSPAAAAATPQ